jgi:EAL domain-containing protein (putative c-di-GMP-specific phosphodiesterase class I)
MARSLVAQPPLIAALSEATVRNLDRVLRAARAHLSMDVAFVAEFMGTNRIFRNIEASGGPVRAGGVMPLAIAYCRRVVEGSLPEMVPNTMALAATRALPETHSVPIGAHLCVPLRLSGGRLYGTFCCFSYVANPSLRERDLQLMKAFAEVIARQIDHELRSRRQRDRKLHRIEEAIDNGDPQLVFQPICRLDTGVITGVEALARFTLDPETPTDVWFADAEEVGIAAELELIAIRKAVALASAMPGELTLNLNASPGVLSAADLGTALEPIGPERVVLELSEHKRVDDYDGLLDMLAPLKSRGTRIAVDDAGAGYASMRHMLSIKPDVLKLDVSLIRGIDHDPARHALASALIEFARITGTHIVAEGIETPGELKQLRKLGVERGQGYYLSRPLPMPIFLDLFEKSGGQMANLAPIAMALPA